MSRSTGKVFTVYSALCKVMYMLPCKYKKRSLSVLFLIMEALSIVVDQFGTTKLLVVLAAFLLSALGFAINLVTCIKRSAKPRKAEQLEVVEFVFSLIQLVATFLHLVLTVSNLKYNYNSSMFFPLAFALIAVIFAFRNDGEHGHSQSRHLPLTHLPTYNFEPGSSHTPNNSMPRNTPIEPNGLVCNPFVDESEHFLGKDEPSSSHTPNNSMPRSTPIEPDGPVCNPFVDESEPFLGKDEPSSSHTPNISMPRSTPIEPNGHDLVCNPFVDESEPFLGKDFDYNPFVDESEPFLGKDFDYVTVIFKEKLSS